MCCEFSNCPQERESVDRNQVTEDNADVMLMPFSNAAKIQTKSLFMK